MSRNFAVHHAIQALVDVVGLVRGTIDRNVGRALELHPIFHNIVVQLVELPDDFDGAVNGCDGPNFFPDPFHLTFHVFSSE